MLHWRGGQKSPEELCMKCSIEVPNPYCYWETTTATAAQLELHYATSSRCASGDHCNHSKKHNSNHVSVHQWFAPPSMHRSNSPPIGFLTLKLPPPPCAVLLVILLVVVPILISDAFDSMPCITTIKRQHSSCFCE